MDKDRLHVSLEPAGASRRDIACEAVVVSDPETGESERFEVSEVGQHADPALLRQMGREWFMEDR